ncbi:hypothetical protein ACFXTH_035274 [Malus domestica]
MNGHPTPRYGVEVDRTPVVALIIDTLGSNESKSRFLSQVAFSCWFIWKARCDAVFNSRTPSLSQTIFNLSSAWENFVIAKSRESGLVPPLLPSRDRAVKRVEVPASSADVAKSLAVLEGCAWEILPIRNRIWVVGKTFQACSWSWFPRSANYAVNFVAKNFTSKMCNSVWANRPPSSLVRILNKDGLACPPSG